MRPRPGTVVCLAIVVGWLAVALAGPLLPLEATRVDLQALFARPTFAAPFGYDDLGRSIARRLLAGAHYSVSIALAVVAVSSVFGTAVGMFVAWRGGLVDLFGMRVMDTFLAFPGILLAIGLSGMLGPGLGNVVLALSVMSWVGFARLARVQTLTIKRRDHVTVARALGTPDPVILYRHVLPLIAAPLIVEATFAIGGVVLAEAGLSYLGLGAQPPTPSWGAMIRDATQFLLVAPHMVVGPGAALLSLVVAVNVLGDRLRERWRTGRDEPVADGLRA